MNRRERCADCRDADDARPPSKAAERHRGQESFRRWSPPLRPDFELAAEPKRWSHSSAQAPENSRPGQARWHSLPAMDSWARLVRLRWPRATHSRLWLATPMAPDSCSQVRARSGLRKARVCRCLQDRGLLAFSQATPAGRKCNRGGRCGGFPICARCRTRRSRP